MTQLLQDPVAPDAGAPVHRKVPLSCLAPLPPGVKAKPNTPKLLQRDLRTLTRFISVYCEGKHHGQSLVVFRGMDLRKIVSKPVELCPECTKLLQHALVKRTHCPRDPKPQCKHCPTHCYAKHYRQQIRQVMRYSGMKLLFSGRLDYLFHLLF